MLQLQIMTSVAILGAVSDDKLFLHQKFMDFDRKCSIREKLWPVTQNAKIHGFCELHDFRLALVIGSVQQTEHKHPEIYLSHVHIVV